MAEYLSARTWKVTLRATANYRRLSQRWQRLVVVTGSVGKTTTTRAILNVLGHGLPRWVHAEDNCFASLGLNLIRLGMRSAWVALEVGIGRRGQMDRYAAALRPDVVVVTAVTTDHIEPCRTDWVPIEKRSPLPFVRLDCGEPIQSAEQLWNEKAAIVRSLPATALVVLNGDDAGVLRMRGTTAARCLTYGMTPGCDYRAQEIILTPRGTLFTLAAEGQVLRVDARLIGVEAVRGLLAAAAVGRAAGLDWPTIVQRIEHVTPTPSRMQPIQLLSGAIAICDDFKAGGETMHAALHNLAAIEARRRLVVLGSLFAPHRPIGEKYAVVGQAISECADLIVLVGRRAQLYRRGFTTLPPHVPVLAAASVEEAALLLQENLGAGDVVLIKGQGGQKLSRIALRLAGDPVDCPLKHCRLDNMVCQECPHARSSRSSVRWRR